MGTRCALSAPRSPAVERVATFYPEVTVADERHCHVPLLLSLFSYSTYRGESSLAGRILLELPRQLRPRTTASATAQHHPPIPGPAPTDIHRTTDATGPRSVASRRAYNHRDRLFRRRF
ncbi:hydroxyisourate hydrolase [Nocardia sp. NPDC047654]|uniref:hydroxyisourate hydrolase n=1 Tax=Nocardia sp. NPDC047654 TaxID=3364314 RepID=UPI003710BD12